MDSDRDETVGHEATVKGIGISVESGEDGGGQGREQGIPAVIVEARGELLPIFVSTDQARSMQLALRGKPFDRPLTHDLLVDMVAEFGGAIDGIRIDDLADGTFYSKVDAEQYRNGERRDLVFDARPSDGIALALRVDCPITVSDPVLDEAAYPPGELDIQKLDDETDRC
jgi:bifunctional DNase/RNase